MMELSARHPYAPSRERFSTAHLLGQVMFLVAVAVGFLALGTFIGRELAIGTARICSFVGLGMSELADGCTREPCGARPALGCIRPIQAG